MASDILIVDDEADIRELVSGILEDEGHKTRLAKDSDEALRVIEERRPSLVILDIWLQGSKLDGLEVLARIKKQHPELPVVIISGHGNIETAVTAIKRGAYDYIEKPFKADRLVVVTMRALEASKLRRENKELKEKSSYSSDLIGKSADHEPPAPEHPESGADQQPRHDHGAARVGQGTRRALSSRLLKPRERSVRRGQRGLHGGGPGRDRVLRRRGDGPDRTESWRARRSP